MEKEGHWTGQSLHEADEADEECSEYYSYQVKYCSMAKQKSSVEGIRISRW